MGIGGSRSFRRFLLPLALALAGCPFSADGDGDGDGMNAGAGGGAASGGTSGSGGGGPGGTGGAIGGTGGTGEDSKGAGGTGGTGGNTGGTGGTGGSSSADDSSTVIPVCGDEPDDPLQIVDAHVEGHTLFVTVQHSGGCEEHAYGLCQNDDWNLSSPPSVGLHLTHDAMGDTCEALLTTELTFDLRVLGAQFENRVGGRAGTLELLLGDAVLLYTFDLDADEPDPDFADLDARLEEGNHCESLEECVAVHVAPCSTRYVSANEDVEALQSDLDAWAAAEGLDQLACLALCQCGVLTCTEGKCTTAVDTECDATETPTERAVCL